MNSIEFSLNSYVNTYVNMIAVNYSELRAELKSLLDKVEHDNELVVIKRSKGRGCRTDVHSRVQRPKARR